METEQTTVADQTTESEIPLSNTTELPHRRIVIFLIPCLLSLLTLFAYWQVRYHPFISLDDNLYVTDNVHVQRGLTWENVVWSFTTTHAGNWHPLTWLSHLLDVELCGLHPAGHHMTNLLLHIANVLILFWAFQRMTGSFWKNLFVAVLFALHPLRVESVAWVAERKDLLSGLFWMLTMLAYTTYVQRPCVKRYAAVLGCFVLGLLSKPMGVTLPFVLLLLDYWPFGRLQLKRQVPLSSSVLSSPAKASSTTRLILEKIPLFLITIISCVLTLFAQWQSGAVGSLQGLSISDRIANALVSYVQYISKMLWPQNLAVLYPHPLHWPVWEVMASGFFLGMVTFPILWASKKYPYLLVGWLWYLGTLVPVIGLVQVGVQAMADRYTYLPLIGLFLMVAYGIPDVLKWGWSRKLAFYVIAPTLIVALFCLTRNQVRYWQSSAMLFEHTLRATVNNSVIHNNLGVVLSGQGKENEARSHFIEALKIRPQYADAHYNLGASLAREGKDTEAVTHLMQALQWNPGLADAHNHLGAISLKNGNLGEAASRFAETVRINPDHAYGHNNLAAVLIRQKRFEEAIPYLGRAIQISPAYAEAHLNLGIAYWETGKRDLALSEYEILQRIDPVRASLLSQSMK